MTCDDEVAEAIIERERRLLRPEVRADRQGVAALLHPSFQEYGASGRVWDREAILAALAEDPTAPGTAEAFAPTRLAEDVVLLTYRVTGEGGSLRSSVWVRDGASGWRLRFHQGTPVAS
jgi:hypothetical protein